MNNLRVMPCNLSTSHVLPLIWILQEVAVLTGGLSSRGRGPLTVTGSCTGQGGGTCERMHVRALTTREV